MGFEQTVDSHFGEAFAVRLIILGDISEMGE